MPDKNREKFMSSLLNKKFSPEEQYDILSRGTVDFINKEEFLKKLKEKKNS